ncbi:lantibiotic dehydratase [Amycolatopsis aidingensis]|uniref:lantibiotic dehydratase n=1 Tax=Amycolatopsis aidingensis TaxID=2842453 RepID=UPI001C0BE8A9|nr:lantibiotic dehydratase [Amycolatopsis aidingensis]
MAAPRHFRHTGLVVVRASTDPGGLRLPRLDLHTAEGAETIGRAWLARTWDRGTVRTALRVASPALCKRITTAVSGTPLSRRQWRRLLVAVSSYLLRWRGRATPFGLFAGVTTATIGPSPRAMFGDAHAVRARLDPDRLADLISWLEHDPAVLAHLRLTVNNAGTTRGDQFVVPRPVAPARAGKTGTTSPLAGDLKAMELAVRRSRPVDAVLAAADRPVRGQELITRLERDFTASCEQVTTMLAGLIEHHILVTNLRAPATSTDPVAHLLTELDTLPPHADAHDAERVATVRDALRCLHESLSEPDLDPGAPIPCPAGIPGRHRNTASGPSGTTTVAPSTRPEPPAIEVAIDGRIQLPETVLHEAETAASTLLRLTRGPFGTGAWRDYHQRFRDRYGTGAVVGVRELVSDAGLGYPVGFLGAARDHPVRPLTDRDAVVQRMVQEAVLDGGTEIHLSADDIEQLTVGDHTQLVPPERVEIAFRLHAHSANALQRGRFQLWVTGAPPTSSSMIGRFAPLLDAPARDRLAASYATSDPDVMVAQLSFPPRRPRNDAVTRVPCLMPWLLPIAEHPTVKTDTDGKPGRLTLQDLAVTASATRFFLIHCPTGKRVQAHVPHALETTVFTPPLVRFIAELATARSAVWGPFDFGAARTLPFLPRIRAGRSVLAPARWLLDSADLPGPRAEPRDWQDALAAWRHRWRVPAQVVLCEGEQRLPLDLEDPTQLSLLRTRLRRGTEVELRETARPADQEWIGRAAEFVVPLTTTHPDRTRAMPRTGPTRSTGTDDRNASRPHLPMTSTLLMAQVDGHPQRFDTILTTHLPQLRDRIRDAAVRTWFRRHHDTTRPESDHYLQLWVRLTSTDQYGTVAAQIAEWTAELRQAALAAHLRFDTAWTQPGKYGTDLPAAEQVFATDSAAALAQLGLVQDAHLPNPVVAAVSMADLATALAPTPHQGWRWLTTVLGQQHGPTDPTLREHALHLAKHLGHPTHEPRPHHTAAEAAVLTAWAHRRTALTEYRTRLDRDPSTVLRALLHDHVTRAVAVHPEQEEATNRLARAIALRATALASQEHP